MEELKLFNDEELEQQPVENQGPVTCLGMEFANDEERRRYFREKLRKKLPELRKIEGFPIGEDDDIIALSDPPYYTACPNPWLNDFIAEWEKEKEQLVTEGKRNRDKVVTEPYAADVSEGKNNPIYMAHAYHTKVPHPAIMRYILHYTEPGDIVFDGFCGTGMTGVAANICDSSKDVRQLGASAKIGARHCICSDLAPYATHIAASYNVSMHSKEFIKNATKILNDAETLYGWMYKFKDKNGKTGDVSYYIWSEVLVCPTCGGEVNLWKAATKDAGAIILEEFKCPHCGAECTKKSLTRQMSTEYDKLLNTSTTTSKYEIVRVNGKIGGKRCEFDAVDFDFQLYDKAKKGNLTNIQVKLLPPGVKSRGNENMGIVYAHQFFTHRNLVILDYIYSKVKKDVMLLSWFTSALINVSRMWKFKPDRKGGNLNGTLYIPSLSIEQNPIEVLRRKITAYKEIDYIGRGNSLITNSSATDLRNIKSNTVDYIFVDPPFGANLMYSELNSIGESWLNIMTNNKDEAIVDLSTQKKSLFDYQKLMNASLKEFYRILKPGKWLTMEFSNTSASVWNSIQNAIQGVGFVVANVAALDKQQGSFNAVTSTTAVKQDLIMTCYKPSDTIAVSFEQSGAIENIWTFIDDYLQHLPAHLMQDNKTITVVERTPKILYDRVITYYVQHGYPVPMDAAEFQSGLRSRYIERDGMFFTAQQAAEYEEKRKTTTDFVPMGLLIGGEADGIAWLRRELETPQTYQDLQPKWMQALTKQRKGDMQIEMRTLLEENFIEESDGKWRLPDPEEEADREKLRIKGLMREFAAYAELATKPKSKIKQVRLEALREGFKQCWQQKAFETIVNVGDKIPEEMLQEDEVLLRYYDIASRRVL